MDDTEACRNMIEELALRHVRYGVLEEHYPKVGEALMQTIEQVFGTNFSPEKLCNLAKRLFGNVRIMIAAAYPAKNSIAV